MPDGANIPSPPEAVMRWAIIVLVGLLAVAFGFQGTQMFGQTTAATTPHTEGPTNAVLEERIKGQQALVGQKLDDLKGSVDSFLSEVAQIARDTSSIEAAVREQGFTIAGLRAQIDAGIRSDADQDETIARLEAAIEQLRQQLGGVGQ